jgi:hypothetical protein
MQGFAIFHPKALLVEPSPRLLTPSTREPLLGRIDCPDFHEPWRQGFPSLPIDLVPVINDERNTQKLFLARSEGDFGFETVKRRLLNR